VPLRLAGDVQDDGLPSRNVSVEWVMVSGPGTASFSPANAPGTLVSFSQPGTYMLRLMGDDSQLSASDDVTVTVAPPPVQIVSLTPDSAAPGQATVTIRTKYSHFVNGTTEANFGDGLSVGGAAANTFGKVVVLDATTATAQVQVAGDAALGTRTVIVRTGTEVAAKADAFIVGALGTPIAIRVNPTDPIVAPGGSITVQPQLVDAAGNVVSTGNPAFTLTVTPKPGKTEGNAPQVNGLTVSFPKLAKQFRNRNVEVDPEGRYADGHPADPNYGKETGGIYTLTVQAGGLTGSVDVAVLPSGTAEVTLKVHEYSRDLSAVMKALQLAAVSHDVSAVLAAKAQLAGVLATTGYSWKMLSSNNVLAPPNGYPVSLAQVQGHFTNGPDDAQFASVLDALIVHLRNTRERLEAIDMSRISDSDLDAWQAANATYKMLSDQLAALSPEPLGLVANSYRLNTILRDEAPRLLDTMARKAMEFLNQMPGQQQVQSMSVINQSGIADINFYLNIMAKLFPLATNTAGTLNGNITELGITLANSLANIALANILNYFSSGSLTIDYVMCGADFSFACPNYPNTYVEGSGFGSNPEDNAVTLIGCLNSNAIRTLVGLKMRGGLERGVRYRRVDSLGFFHQVACGLSLGGPGLLVGGNSDGDSAWPVQWRQRDGVPQRLVTGE